MFWKTSVRRSILGITALICVTAGLLGTPASIFVNPATLTAATAASTIILWPADVPASDRHGDWVRIAASAAAGGAALMNPDASRAKIAPALAAPANYFEIAFTAVPGVPYRLWLRMAATANSIGNDSVHVQFNDSVDAGGAAVARIGTANSAEVVLQDGPTGAAPRNWGWSDNGWGALGSPIYFASSGTHVIRVQQREDGAILDQIVLSPNTYSSVAPGGLRDDTTLLARTDGTSPLPSAAGTAVLWTANVPDATRFGNWQRIADTSAAGGFAFRNPNVGIPKIAPALTNPVNYFETSFTAEAGRPYHVWLRMNADLNSLANDSVHVQFNDSLNPSGAAFARIGTTSSAEFVLQAGPLGAIPRGWGWTDNGWGALGAHIMFSKAGTHTIRIQQREDGPTIDQIVISPDAYLTTSPGAQRDDTVVLKATAPPPLSTTWKIVFAASADHATSKVTSYALDVFASGAVVATAAPLASVNLGKPAPAKNGDITLDQTTFLKALSVGNYLVTVSAVGPGGKTSGAPLVFSR